MFYQVIRRFLTAAARLSRSNIVKKQRNKISAIEKQISDLEEKIKVFEIEMQDPEKYQALISDTEYLKKYNGYKADLNQAFKEWESLI